MRLFYNFKSNKLTRNGLLILAIIVFCLSLIYLTTKVFIKVPDAQGLDFRFLWLAGKLWGEGKNPYDNMIWVSEYKSFFGYEKPNWAYPPHFAPILMFLAIFPFKIAELLWRVINYSSLIIIIIMTGLWIKNYKVKLNFWKDIRFWIGASYCCLLQSTLIVFSLGQTSIICVLGLVLILYGACQNYLILGIVGGYLLSIKPQIAIVILTALFFAGHHRIVAGSIVLITLASALAFYQTGLSENIQGFLTNLSAYSQEKVNQPPDLTGLVHLIDYFLSIQVSSKIMALFGVILGTLCGFLISRGRTNSLIKLGFDGSKPNFFQIGSIILTVIATGFLMPIHVYDFVIFLPIVIASLYLPFRY
ncbi:glycosyltransferase family 87 protein, partial [Crocosphaera chwakensis]